MENTKSLLMMVLHKIFQNQPKTVENTFQLIHNYNTGKINQKEYEQVLKTICDLMNDQLPSQILVYLLTLVDMPKEYDSQSSIVEKMKKTRDCLPEVNARPHLLEFLNNIKPSVKNKNATTNIKPNKRNNNNSNKNEDSFLKPKVPKRNVRKIATFEVKNLLDLCASYVINNDNKLKEMYQNKEKQAKELMDKNGFLKQDLLNVINDANKKVKLLKAIECNNLDCLINEYEETEIVLKKYHVYEEVYKNPFELSDEVTNALFLLKNNPNN